MKKQKFGFTLIELLVVISIIGILMALALTGMGGARKNARDTQRKSDIGQYAAAIEGYAGDNSGRYPNQAGDSNTSGGTGIFDAAGLIIDEYMTSRIDDPINTASYRYEYYIDATYTIYKLRATLETGGWWETCSNGKSGKTIDDNASTTCSL
ncbi:MAG TPA: type II secretion system protein [Candidatus Bathyarchaeia archaeon]|nr:type II secretion system protein [Candidatus Bathyarchaeia archaeon]